MRNVDGVLPLRRDARVAVIGPAADDERLLQGDYSYPAHTEILQLAAGPYYPASVTPLAGMRAIAPSSTYAKGCGIRSTRTDQIGDAVAAARAADVAVCFVGGRSGLMPDCTSGEFRDASDLALPGAQPALVEAVVASGTPTVVVVMSGRVHALPWIAEHAAALLYAWVPGEQGGAAVADVLFGERAPEGRLPVSLPRNAGQVPIHHDVRAGGGRSAIFGDYVDGPATPLFPFGFGMGYTTFGYDALAVDELEVRVDVANTGPSAGTDVVQLFARDDVARVARPERQLVGFARVELQPGQRRTVCFRVDPSAFAYYDEQMRLVVEPGTVTFFVGALTANAELPGPEREIHPNARLATQVEISS